MNRQIGEKILKILKIICEKAHVQEKFFKDSNFSKVLLKDFAETFQNAYREKYTFSDTGLIFTAFFP